MEELDEDVLRHILEQEVNKYQVVFTASGSKSSEGDGRTAADIEKELREKNGS